jgi:hypothetical protein
MKNKSVYIMSLNSAYLYRDFKEKEKTTIESKDLTKLYSATMPYSLETMRIFEKYPDELFEQHNKQYTNGIINLSFGDKYYILEEYTDENTGDIKKKRKTLASSKKIRKHFYQYGLIIDDEKYVFYKRGAGKAKNGDALFIKESMVEYLRRRSRLGLDFSRDKTIDFTSILAYESLISSGIEGTIDLDFKTEVLLITDLDGLKFKTVANITEEVNGELTSENKEIELQNCLTDGHGLMDESVFEYNGKSDKSFMLLRTDFFKCCAFNTKLNKFFKANNVEYLFDMFGNKYDASKIKLVTTPNSLKFLKFSNRFDSTSSCYDYYLGQIDNLLGVVKFDKRGNYGEYNRTTYQLLNSIPYLTRDELRSIVLDEVNYINLLQNDSAVFLNYIGMDSHASIEFEKQSDDDDKMDNIELMNALLLVNSDIQYTKKFKKMKKELIKNRINHLLMGKIRMKDTIYATLISNPYEMLSHSIGVYDGTSIMRGREIWCPQYSDGQELAISRNPHINAGNVMHSTNKYRDEYDWFNFNSNVCVINFNDNDAPDRLQGCDTDSDTILLLPNTILVEHAKRCEQNFPTPINKVKGEVKLRKNNMSQLAELDTILSENYIGRIINLSQIINSYMNHAIHNNYEQSTIDELYKASCKCSSLSQIEIDKSKKSFDNINMSKELSAIKQCKGVEFVDDDDVKKMVVPHFFGRISEFSEYRVFKKMDTPMDYLEDVLVFDRVLPTKNLEFGDLIIQQKDIYEKQKDRHVQPIFESVVKCGKKINGLRINNNKLSDKAKKTIEYNSKLTAIGEISDMKNLNQATILDILRQCLKVKNDSYGFSGYAMLTMNLFYNTHRELFLKCFKSKDMLKDEVLDVSSDGSINIFGKKYIKTDRKALEKR